MFIAGHKGLVGSAILRRLYSAGYKKIITADKNKLNLIDQKKVFSFLKKNKPKFIFLAAAVVIYATQYKADFIYENLAVQSNVIHGAFKANIKNLILGSSCIYPKFSKQPIKEDYLLLVSLKKQTTPTQSQKLQVSKCAKVIISI